MVHAGLGDDANGIVQRRGGIPSAAKAGFNEHPVRALLFKQGQRHPQIHFKHGHFPRLKNGPPGFVNLQPFFHGNGLAAQAQPFVVAD